MFNAFRNTNRSFGTQLPANTIINNQKYLAIKPFPVCNDKFAPSMIQIQGHFETIANGLADQGYAVIDHFLSPDDIKQILGLNVFTNGSFRKAGIGKESKQVNEAIRGDSIFWVDKESADPPLKIYLNRLDEMRLFLNQSLYLSLKDYEVHLASYPAGAFYKR